tara:strand:+ start:3422 stop:3808 length:387 start_codon:yes stop_codon:yes gene_type:complete
MPLFSSIGLALGASAAAAAATGAAVVGAAAAAGGLGYTISAGEEASRKQEDALMRQKKAQTEASNAAQGQRRQSEMAINKANQQTPNVAGIMQSASAAAGGSSGTMLTGPGGVNPNALSLGKSTLLGS